MNASEGHPPLNVAWSKLPHPLSYSSHDPETLKRGAGGLACFLKGTEFIVFGGDEKLAWEVMFGKVNSATTAESGSTLGFSLAGKKGTAAGMNIASK
jgi:hypothetical protein